MRSLNGGPFETVWWRNMTWGNFCELCEVGIGVDLRYVGIARFWNPFKMAVLEASMTSKARENMKKTPKNDNKQVKKVLVVAQELKLARVLAGNNKTARDRALKSLRKWFQNRATTIRKLRSISSSCAMIRVQLSQRTTSWGSGKVSSTPCGCRTSLSSK